ncbi:sensor histidine kinase [Micropruina sp.]|uniref:sensor histidine kinase n=1 Tax=Micropruina sp. TaxID=2737536 RepID=UPI0039E23D3E
MALLVRAGNLGRADPARGATASGLRLWLARAVAMTCLVSLIPALFIALGQLPYLHPVWLVLVGGGIVGFTLLMPVYAWSLGDIRWLCGAYALVILVGVITWPWAWLSTSPAGGAPWLWVCLGMATVCAAMASTVGLGFAYAAVSSLAFGLVRLTVAGGNRDPLSALQDVLTLMVLPTALLLLIQFFARAVDELDASTAESQRVEADRAIDKAIGQRRTILDGIIHDQVMTTLVAAVQTDQPRGEVADLAKAALASLAEAAAPTNVGQSLSAPQLARLIEGMVEAVCPQATVRVDPGSDAVPVTASVASTLGQAAREAALNVTRHAEAEHVSIEISAGLVGNDQRVRVDVRDDGRGFDPGDVAEGRFGIKVSMMERMAAIGGTVDIESKPGEGTLVSLRWSGRSQQVGETISRRRASEALRSVLRVELFLFLVWLVVGVQVLVGLISAMSLPDQTPVLIAQGLAVVATGIALRRAGERSMTTFEAGLVVVALAVIAQLVHAALPLGSLPNYSTWHSSVIMALLITVLVRGQRSAAWLGLGVFVVQAGYWAYSHQLGVAAMLQVTFGPVLWLTLATLVLRGLGSIGEQLVRVRTRSRENTKAMAESFSNLVLREVWLTELRGQIGPLLQNLADPTHQLSQAERDACRILEGRLRDALRAGNLVSQGVSDAIQAARGRGVEVVLVDNRGSKLPEPVRLATLRRLEDLVKTSTSGRIVARTAPEGYSEAVTILTVDAERNLTTIDEAGTVTVRKT